MIILNPEKPRDRLTPRIDVDLVFIDISKTDNDSYEYAIECLVSAITAQTMMRYGKPPEEI